MKNRKKGPFSSDGHSMIIHGGRRRRRRRQPPQPEPAVTSYKMDPDKSIKCRDCSRLICPRKTFNKSTGVLFTITRCGPCRVRRKASGC